MIYCYATEDGQVIERDFPMGTAPKDILVKGQVAHRSFQAEHAAQKSDKGQFNAEWPKRSEAMGVHPSQIEEAKKLCPSSEFDKDGALIARDQKHLAQCAKEAGMTDCYRGSHWK